MAWKTNKAAELKAKLDVLKADLYGPWGADKNMRNYKIGSSRYIDAKAKFDELKPQYDAVLKEYKALTKAETKKTEKESAAKNTADIIKKAKEDITKADSNIKRAADLGDSKLYDEAQAAREKAAGVLTTNKVDVPFAPVVKTPDNSTFKPTDPTTINANKADGTAPNPYDKYVLNADGTVVAAGTGGTRQYLVTLKNPKTGKVEQTPFGTVVDARNAFLKEYYSKPGDIERLKKELRAKNLINDNDLAQDLWYKGVDDFIVQYTTHAVSQVKYGEAKDSDPILSYFSTVKNLNGIGSNTPKVYKNITTRGDAKRELDAYLTDLIGRPSTLQEQEDYYTQLHHAESTSVQTVSDGTTTGRLLPDADRMLIAANVAKKALKGTDIDKILASKKGSQVAVDVTNLQKLATDYGVPMNAVEALKYIRAGLGTADTLKKQEERIRQLSMTIHPYLKDHIAAGGTVKDVTDVFALAKTNKLGTVVPDSTKDKDVMDAVAKGMNVNDFNVQLQGKPEWRLTPEAHNVAADFTSTILRSFGFGG